MENKEKELMEIREQIIDAMGKVCKIGGLNEVTGRLYGVLFLSEHPLTLDDMASHLGMSKPSMSIHIRQLEKIGMVHNVWKRGSRKNYYAAETNIEKMIHGFMEREKIALDVMLSTIENSKINFNRLKEESDGKIQEKIMKDLDRISHLEEYLKAWEKILGIFLAGNIKGDTKETEIKTIDIKD